jgi:hypothetical protein
MRRFLVDRSLLSEPQGQGAAQPNPPQAQSRGGGEINLDEIVSDPALRKPIHEYAPEIRDQIKRAYILKGPTQPIVNFPKKKFGDSSRAFQQAWYKKFDWLEYSVSKDAAFCFYCFLFKEPGRAEFHGFDVFNKLGFNNWKMAYKSLPEHVGGINSGHNKCVEQCDDFKNQRQSISSKLSSATREAEELYQTRLTSSLECLRFLIGQGMAFRGHDESSSSLNKGNFLEMIDWYKEHNELVRHSFNRGGLNCQMISPKIQKDLARCCAEEVTDVIMGELGDKHFSILIDESLVEHHHERLLLLLDSGEVSTGRGQLQETNLTRPGDTRWGSHQKTLLRIELMWDSVIEVLGIVERDGRISSAAGGLIEKWRILSLSSF